MLKKLINECAVELRLHTIDPILVKSGMATVNGADMAFVVTYRNGGAEPYLPGSSLKGVLRSHAERIARSLKSPSVCEPFWNNEIQGDPARVETMWCGERLKRREKAREEISNPTAYRDSCPACRLFGSTYYVGRFAVSDAYLVSESRNRRPQQRDGVGIDRYTGGASNGAKFNLEVLTDATFECTIRIRNFEVWQLGWLAYVIQDLEDKMIHIGSGKSRGLGRVKGEVKSVTASYLVADANALSAEDGRARLRGIGSFVSDGDYGLDAADEVPLPAGHRFDRPTGKLRHECRFVNDQIRNLWYACADKWDEYISSYEVPAAMNPERLIEVATGEVADD